LIGSQFGFTFNLKIIASLFIFASLIITAFGVWNAGRIQITRITVPIKNLPAVWQNKTIVQISDVHLGSVLGVKFINQIIDKINLLKPQAVVITGDYFDGMDGVLDNLVKPLDRLNPPLGTYFITGNHENYLGSNKSLEIINKTKVKVLNDEQVELNGISLVGVSYPAEGVNKNVAEIINKLKPTRPTILLYHAPSQVKAIAQAGVDLMLSGHTHDGQFWPFNYFTEMIFGKYSSGLNKINDFTIYSSVGIGTWGPAMRVGNRPEIVEITLVRK